MSSSEPPAPLAPSPPQVVVDGAALLARLVPIRGDSHRAQLAQAPMLASVSRGLLEAAAAAIGPAAEPSLYQWLLAHDVEPPAQPQQ